eukprot:1981514-Pyramimonas_sp.AAC.1
MWALPLGPSAEFSTGPRRVALGAPEQRHAKGRGQGGRREEGEEEGGTRGGVSSKRGPTTTGWLGPISCGAVPAACRAVRVPCRVRVLDCDRATVLESWIATKLLCRAFAVPDLQRAKDVRVPCPRVPRRARSPGCEEGAVPCRVRVPCRAL